MAIFSWRNVWSFENNGYLCIAFREMHNTTSVKGGNSSVGRARPCQGRGREFESRLPLFFTLYVFLRETLLSK